MKKIYAFISDLIKRVDYLNDTALKKELYKLVQMVKKLKK